jgi:hypothetical protein
MNTAEVRLGQTGRVALVDEADLPLLEGWRFYYWNPKAHLGPPRVIAKKFSKGLVKQSWLNRIIVGALDPSVPVRHIDGDGLNCRRSNLKEGHSIA